MLAGWSEERDETKSEPRRRTAPNINLASEISYAVVKVIL
jgi:hypothetical protein